jgi:hypothetical protein
MNADKTFYSVKLTYLQQWQRGVGLLWSLLKMYFLFNIYCIPSFLVWTLIDAIPAQSKGMDFLFWFLGFMVALINLPLALIRAAEDIFPPGTTPMMIPIEKNLQKSEQA